MVCCAIPPEARAGREASVLKTRRWCVKTVRGCSRFKVTGKRKPPVPVALPDGPGMHCCTGSGFVQDRLAVQSGGVLKSNGGLAGILFPGGWAIAAPQKVKNVGLPEPPLHGVSPTLRKKPVTQ